MIAGRLLVLLALLVAALTADAQQPPGKFARIELLGDVSSFLDEAFRQGSETARRGRLHIGLNPRTHITSAMLPSAEAIQRFAEGKVGRSPNGYRRNGWRSLASFWDRLESRRSCFRH